MTAVTTYVSAIITFIGQNPLPVIFFMTNLKGKKLQNFELDIIR